MLHDMKSSACKKIKSKFYYLSHCEIIKNKTDKKMTLVGKSCGGNSGSLVSSLNGEKIFLLLYCTWRPNSVNNKIFIFFIQLCLVPAERTSFPSEPRRKQCFQDFHLLFQIGQKDKSQSQKTLENHTSYHIKKCCTYDKLDQVFFRWC